MRGSCSALPQEVNVSIPLGSIGEESQVFCIESQSISIMRKNKPTCHLRQKFMTERVKRIKLWSFMVVLPFRARKTFSNDDHLVGNNRSIDVGDFQNGGTASTYIYHIYWDMEAGELSLSKQLQEEESRQITLIAHETAAEGQQVALQGLTRF